MSFFVENGFTNENDEESQEDVTIEVSELNVMLGEIERIRKIIDNKETKDKTADDIAIMNAEFQKIRQRLKEKSLTQKDVKTIRNMEKKVIAIMNKRPGLKDRGTTTERIIGKIKAFIETFIDGVD